MQYVPSSAIMKIVFDNPKHEALVNDFEALSRRFNSKSDDNATEILITLNVLEAADTLADIPPKYHPHPLKAEYKGGFAVDVTKKERVIFKPIPNGDPNYRIDNPKSITSISIVEIFIDYHK